MKATAIAGSNIAFIKYWGNLDDDLRIPMNGSISMTLDAAYTQTTIEFSPALTTDTLILNGQPAGESAMQRASEHLDRLRGLADTDAKAQIVSRNSFPTGAGVASSAAGFAALTVAGVAALGLTTNHAQLSRLARLASGSASRSIDGGFVEWAAGGNHHTSVAKPLAPADHWDLVDIIAIVSQQHKSVGSTGGHKLAHSSPYYAARLQVVQYSLPRVRQAILDRDLPKLGELIEADALSLHFMTMTSKPSIVYWNEGTMALMHAIRAWREEQDATAVGYFTMDAGPNVHIIAERAAVPALLEKLRSVPEVEDTIVCNVGPDARLVEDHLF